MTELLFDKKDVFSWANAEDARQYIGKEGYFSDVYCNDRNYWQKAKLIDIHCDSAISEVFISSEVIEECDDEPYTYGLFIPANKVKVEKKLRPFKTIEEFRNALDIGFCSVLVYRRKDEPDMTFTSMFVGYKSNQPTSRLYSVSLGGMFYTVKDLLDKFEWFNGQTEEWCPFGVEE